MQFWEGQNYGCYLAYYNAILEIIYSPMILFVFVVILSSNGALLCCYRQKRVSDQRLGELEALLALKKLRGKLVTVPVAFGQINPSE